MLQPHECHMRRPAVQCCMQKSCSCACKRLPNLSHLLRMLDRNNDTSIKLSLAKKLSPKDILPKVADF